MQLWKFLYSQGRSSIYLLGVLLCRLSQLLHVKSVESDSLPGELESSPTSAREAHIKLKALNRATVKMAAQLEALENENKSLQKKLEMVIRCTLFLSGHC